MNLEEIKSLLMTSLSLQDAFVFTEDNSHYQVIVVGEQFEGMSRVKQQQMVYAPLMDYISSNQIHALSIKAYTPSQWQRERRLVGL